MLKIIAIAIVRKVLFLGIALGVILMIGYLSSDRKDYPGKTQFAEINSKITTRSAAVAQGDSPESNIIIRHKPSGSG